jgi:hypothetical protein
MALKNLSERPTSQADYAWSDYKSYSRTEFTAMYPLGVDSVISIIGQAILDIIPKWETISGITNVFSALTSNKKQEMINGIYTQLATNSNYSGVRISAKFHGYQKGSHGIYALLVLFNSNSPY